MDLVFNIMREGAIVLGLLALVFGVGAGLMQLRRAMGGGIDDHLRFSASPTLAKVTKILLAITAALWILTWFLVRDEYGDNLGQALDEMISNTVPAELLEKSDDMPPAMPADGPAPPTR